MRAEIRHPCRPRPPPALAGGLVRGSSPSALAGHFGIPARRADAQSRDACQAAGVATFEAVLGGEVIASSDRTVVVDGNHYFPPSTIRAGVLQPSGTRTICPWKGRAKYFAAEIDGRRVDDVAWTYRHPTPLARRISGFIAFAAPVNVRQVE